MLIPLRRGPEARKKFTWILRKKYVPYSWAAPPCFGLFWRQSTCCFVGLIPIYTKFLLLYSFHPVPRHEQWPCKRDLLLTLSLSLWQVSEDPVNLTQFS
jgi:hypothetical protein